MKKICQEAYPVPVAARGARFPETARTSGVPGRTRGVTICKRKGARDGYFKFLTLVELLSSSLAHPVPEVAPGAHSPRTARRRGN